MKNLNFKKLSIAAIAVFVTCITANGQQKGDFGIGAHLLYGTTASSGSFNNYGAGGRLLYSVSDLIRLDGSLNYFFKKDYITVWTAAVKGHYLIPVDESISVYPLVGLGIMDMKFKYGLGSLGAIEASDSEAGFIIGGGVDLKLTGKISLNIEPDLWIFAGKEGEVDEASYRLMISAGLSFTF